MSWDYSEKLKEHFFNPKNVGTIENPDAVGEEGSLACGDILRLELKIKNEIIVDAKFKTFGCASAIASVSMLTELIIGKSVEEVSKLKKQDIVNSLGGMPIPKIHCSVLGIQALKNALDNYKSRKG